MGFSLVNDFTATKGAPHGGIRFRSVLVCTNCEELVIAVFDRPAGMSGPPSPTNCAIDPRQVGFQFVGSYPVSAPTKMPAHVGDDLKRFFSQAVDGVRRQNWDASGAMSRKVVDVSTKQLLCADASKFRDMRDRIDELGKRHQLTPDLVIWAHEVRLGGNDAVHDEDPFTQTEAEELLDFTELYMTYVYTLPGRLAERKARAASAKAASTPAKP